MSEVQCPNCRAITSGDATFCPKCGAALSGAPPVPAAASPFPTPVVGQPSSSPFPQPIVGGQTSAPYVQPAPPPPPAPAPQAPMPQAHYAPVQASAAPGAYAPPAPAPGMPGAPPPGYGAPPAQAPPAMGYAPPPMGAATALSPAKQMGKDAFILRAVALLLDGFMAGIVAYILGVAGLYWALGPAAFIAWWLLPSVLLALYMMIMEGQTGQTIGKMIFGLKVVKEDLSPITPKEAQTRAMGILLYPFLIPILLDLVWVSEEGQRLADKWAHTTVIKTK